MSDQSVASEFASYLTPAKKQTNPDAYDGSPIVISGTNPPPSQSISDEFASHLVAPVAQQSPEQPTSWEKYGGELGRQTGLFARHAVTGLTGLPAVVGNALNGAINLGTTGINAATGSHIPQLQMPSQAIQDLETRSGLPEPKNGTEQVVGAGSSAMAGLLPSLAAGNALTQSINPVNVALGRSLTTAPINQIAAATGAGTGGQLAANAGLNPYWQLGASLLGGGAGSVASAGLGSFMKAAGRTFAPDLTETIAPGSVPKYVNNAETGTNTINNQTPFTLSPDKLAEQSATTDAFLRNNPGADPSSAARAADFRDLGMRPTLGQITRDPGLFADEQNLRGQTVGAPLLQRFTTQNQQLANILDSYKTNQTPYEAGNIIQPALKNIDNGLKSQVTNAYNEGAQSSGKTLNVPLQGVAQDYAQVLHDFGDKVPSGVQNNFNDLGLNTGMQKKVFTVEDAENLLKVINSNKESSIGPSPTNEALNRLSTSVKNAVLSADDQGGAFANARSLAAKRFALHEQIPALQDAVYGNTKPEDFTNNFVINGGVDEVRNLSNLLKNTSPAAMDSLQGQVGNKLNNSAFGVNPAGDRVFSPTSYAKALTQSMGHDLLSSVYSPEDLDKLNTVGRVGSYINSPPAASPVNFSNTGSAAIKMLQDIPYIGKVVESAGKRSMVARSLRGELGDTVGNMVPQPNGGAIPVNLNNSALGQVYARALQDKDGN